jgi:hypothetical protein
MIKNWSYNNTKSLTSYVKDLIKENNYNAVDVGASAHPWSFPECSTFIDTVSPNIEGGTFFKLNLESEEDRNMFLKHIEINGKFDFSICSHTIEDIFNPIDAIKFLVKISKKGYLSIPSKYNEFKKLYDNKYRGNAHHKQFFDVKDDKIIIYPKFSFIETDERSDILLQQDKGDELTIFWEDDIDFQIFGNGTPFNGDAMLIDNFFKQLMDD